MKREIIKTSDGSTTIHIPEWNEQYHSIHGAIQEANHVYINNGLKYKSSNEIAVLEIGFGTGLNSFMTFLQAQEKEMFIDYIGVEAFPILKEELPLILGISTLYQKDILLFNWLRLINYFHANKTNAFFLC